MKKAEEILEVTALSDSQVCSRCFRSVAPKESRSGNFGGDTECSDKCGQLGIELESEPVDYSVLEYRASRLYSLLKEEGYDLNKDAFVRAVEVYSESSFGNPDKAPRELFVEAIAHGMGYKSTENLPENSEDDDPPADDSEENDDPINRLARCPQPRGLTSEIEGFDRMRQYTSQFETFGDNQNIYYISDIEGFQSEFSLEIGDHTAESVAHVTVETCWESLEHGSKKRINTWLNDSEHPASNYILSSYLLKKCSRSKKPRHMVNDKSEVYRELRGSTLWPLIKRKKAQPLLGLIRNHSQDKVPLSKIRNEFDEVDGFVRKLLDVLRKNDQVRSYEDGWKYTGDEFNFDSRSSF